MRLLISVSSASSASVPSPTRSAESISAVSTRIDATSVLQLQQNFSVVPGRSNDGPIHPQILHGATELCSVPFGPDNIRSPLSIVFIPRAAHGVDRRGGVTETTRFARPRLVFRVCGPWRQKPVPKPGLGKDVARVRWVLLDFLP